HCVPGLSLVFWLFSSTDRISWYSGRCRTQRKGYNRYAHAKNDATVQAKKDVGGSIMSTKSPRPNWTAALSVIVTGLACAAIAPTATAQDSSACAVPDLLFVNGRIHTMDARNRVV